MSKLNNRVSNLADLFGEEGLCLEEMDVMEEDRMIHVEFSSRSYAGELPNGITNIFKRICKEIGADSWNFWTGFSVRFHFEDDVEIKCQHCGNDLTAPDSVKREYVNIDGFASKFGTGHYAREGHYQRDEGADLSDGRYECYYNSDTCGKCGGLL